MWPTLLSVWSTAAEKNMVFQLDDQLAAGKKKIAAETVVVETPFSKVVDETSGVDFPTYNNFGIDDRWIGIDGLTV